MKLVILSMGLVTLVAVSANASTYALTSPGSWTQADAEATSLGGHLVAINSAAEQSLLLSLFGGTEPLWIGLTDRDVEGVFVWTNGDPLTYTSWAPGEPNNGGDVIGDGEDYVNTNDFRGPGLWNDGHDTTRTFRGIIEFAPEPDALMLLGAAALTALAWRRGSALG